MKKSHHGKVVLSWKGILAMASLPLDGLASPTGLVQLEQRRGLNYGFLSTHICCSGAAENRGLLLCAHSPCSCGHDGSGLGRL